MVRLAPETREQLERRVALARELERRGLRKSSPVKLIDVETPPEWLHPGQLEAWHATERYLLVLSGTQGGKTAMVPYLALREAVRTFRPGESNEGLIASPTYTLQGVKLAPLMRQVICGEMRLGTWTGSPTPRIEITGDALRRLTGSSDGSIVIRFGHAASPESLESATYKWAIGDEFGQSSVPVESIEAIQRRLSTTGGRLIMTTTPYELGWLKERFHDRAIAGDADYRLVRFESVANPAFPRSEWDRAKGDLPGWKFDLFYRAIFTRPAGAIYDNFSRDTDVVEPFDIPTDWPKVAFHDWGGVNMAALFLAQDPKGGTLYVYASYLHGNRTTVDHAKEFIRIQGGLPNVAVGFSRSEEQHRRDFAAAGYTIQACPIIDVEAGIQRVYQAIQRRQVKVFASLKTLIDQIEQYSRELVDGDVSAKIRDKDAQHYCDCLRYGLSYLSEVGGIPVKPGSGPRVWSRFGTVEKEIDPLRDLSKI